MIDGTVKGDLRERLRACQEDWRNAFAWQDGNGCCRVFPAELARRCDQQALKPAGLASVATPLEPLRAEPAHRAELISEVRGGEWLTLLAERGEWAAVACEDDYVGWIARWTLVRQSTQQREEQRARLLGHFARPLGTLWDSDSWASSPLVLGTPLLTAEDEFRERGGRRLVELPWGPKGWLPEGEIQRPTPAYDAAAVLRHATMLLGTPYRWGGRSAASLDCSGFVQLLFEGVGIRLPRDASQQSGSGDALALDEAVWRAGDLLFFGEPADHVGIVDGRGCILHCRAFVRRQPLGEIPELMARLSAARRIGPATRKSTLWCP